MSIASITSLLLISPVMAMAQQATASLPCSNPSPLCATLVLHGGKIWTGDHANPEATAIAIYRHRIVVVGSDAAALALAGEPTRVIDLGGRRVVPGLIDDHAHFLPPRRETSPVPRGPNLRASNSEAEFARGIGKYVAQLPAGTWFTAGSWNHARWPGGKLPTRALVDMLSPNNPVCLVAGAGHIAFANGAALKIASMMEDLSPGGSLEQRYARCVEAGIQPMTHAIGDKAIRLVLDIFQRVGGENVAKYRFRIEHAQHPQPEEIRRFGKLGIVISAQPYAVISDGVYAEKRLGAKRCETTFPFRDIIDSGAVLAFGSDSGGGSPSPMLGIYAAVTRASSAPNCPDGWIPQQKITVAEALRADTFGTAYACFFDDQAGTLQAGKLADLVVLDTDILNVPPQRIRDAKVLLTIIDGTKSWLAPEAPWKWEIP